MHRLADCLARTFLQPCRQQKISKHLIQRLIFASDNAADQLMRDHKCILFPQKDLFYGLYDLLISPVDLCGQYTAITETLLSGIFLYL